MDITCSGSVSREEFELGMSHIGVFLTPQEYEKVYDSLSPELKDFTNMSSGGGGDGDASPNGGAKASFAVKYADFLALFHGKSPLVLPTKSKQTSPPVAGMGNARLWDFFVQFIDRLSPLFQQFEKINQRYVAPDTFHDCLLREYLKRGHALASEPSASACIRQSAARIRECVVPGDWETGKREPPKIEFAFRLVTEEKKAEET